MLPFLKRIGLFVTLLGLLLACQVNSVTSTPDVGNALPANGPTTAARPTPTLEMGLTAAATQASPQDYTYYDIGNPTLTNLYISPTGNDSNTGTSPDTPLQTITAAWNLIPTGTLSTTGYQINLLPGTYPCEPGEPDACFNYFDARAGTYDFPIIIRAAAGPGTTIIRGGLNLRAVTYLYLIDLNLVGGGDLPTNISGNNLLHLDAGDHILVRNVSVIGPDCDNDTCNNLQEVFKVNQAQHLYVENSRFSGAIHSTVDYFVVQHGHFLNNYLATAGQWCMYIKGGTAYLHIEGNELTGCWLGFQAGQSANYAVMASPWIHYEVYDIKFVNNILHDIEGTGLSVAGGYNVLYAYNTLYRVATEGSNGFAMLQFVFGERNCTPTDELPNPLPNCEAFAAAGGWGPNFITPSLPAIPNRNIFVYNNIFYNPPGTQTLYATINAYAPSAPPAGFPNVPNPMLTDENLVIRGNIIWDGGPGHPLGVDETTGCAPTNPTCNLTQLMADNHINEFEPEMVYPDLGDFHPVANGNLYTATTYTIPNFSWSDIPSVPVVPVGNLNNLITIDRDGNSRPASGLPGAYATPGNGISGLYLPLVGRS
ncbi:MAG: right-handed parallel beta-helix repeat-containing protein [Chloroflexi bacterium]|nr:right-handed parallel beta-helix repeat-containing protein [Chloroflexota bacterium]MBP8057303.1 right-handed parallel beta-helix repeat-containing protein [Chloroflexota bacterium]